MPQFHQDIYNIMIIQLQSMLSSWNDTENKKAIIDFVEKISNEGGHDFVPVAERIAIFDNDGTLWTESFY
jgi:hypothetical protein